MFTLLFAACTGGSKSVNNADCQNKAPLSTVKKAIAKKSTAPTKEVLSAYLELKSALAKDDHKAAAQAGKSLVVVIIAIDKALLSTEQSKVFMDIADDAKEHAEHIGANVGNIKHQREHFETLSQEIYYLVKAGGSPGQELYYDNCPMYNSGKGGNWLSETKEIQNPYLGKEMPTCGSIKEELN
jgi:hypothetical protein